MTRRKTFYQPCLEVLEDRVVPSWAGVPPSSIVLPASPVQVTLNSSGDAQGTASIASTEVDYYSFVAPVSGAYIFEATTPSSSLDTVLGVFSSSGSRLAYNDDISSTNWDSRVTVSLTAGQRYYIGITNYTGTPGGGYSWRVDGPSVAVDDAYEENDSRSVSYNLGTLTAPRTISGLALQDSADWFKFTTTNTGTSTSNVTINFLHSQGDLVLALYNSAGTRVGYADGYGNSETLSLNGLATGTYYVKVSGYLGAKNPSYSLTINPPSPLIVEDLYEENDSLSAAYNLGTLTSARTISGLAMQDSADWFKFTTTATGTSTSNVIINFLHSQGDLVLELYNSAGTRLGYADGYGNSETLSLNGLATGTYYVKVSGYLGAKNPSYSLTVNPPSPSVVDDAYEENDSLSAAYNLGTLTSARSISGLAMQDSADWFKFTTTSTGTSSSNVTLNFLHSQGDIDVQLYNSAGTLLGSSTGVGDSEQISLNGRAAGTYYIKVYGYNGARNPSYSLTVNPPVGTTFPVLNSLPGAAKTLYLDFDGFYEADWGGYQPGTTAAFDQDGNPSSFSAAELTAIQQMWAQVAEDFAPFNINVTTVEPPSFADGVAMRVVIGGSGAWYPSSLGGLGYVNSFTNYLPNSVYVFSVNLWNGDPRLTAEAIAHEAGHSFGLQHQSQYDANGAKVAEYYSGPGDGRAPIMGNSYSATRGLWWYGTSALGPNSFQDDMAVLAGVLGYRADDHGNTTSAATSLPGSPFNGSGIITQMSDLDYFAFTTTGGQITASVSVLAANNNLDAVLELRDAQGNLIVRSDPGASFGASLTATISAGTYYLVVASHGGYGDVGQYTLSGTVS